MEELGMIASLRSVAVGPAISGRSRAQLGAARTDRSESLVEARPGPWLDLAIAGLRLVAGRLEVLEPGVRLLDHEQLLGLALVHHPGAPLQRSLTAAML